MPQNEPTYFGMTKERAESFNKMLIQCIKIATIGLILVAIIMYLGIQAGGV